MNPFVKSSLLSLGGVVLFAGAFVGFAKLRGAEWHEIAVIGAFFPKPPEGEPDPSLAEADHESGHEPGATAEVPPVAREHEPARKPPPEVRSARLSLLDAFSLESPYTSSQLQALADSLEAKNREAEQRLAAIAEQEQLIADRMEALNEHQGALQELRAKLERMQEELRVRSEELEKDSSLRETREAEEWRARGKLFEEGEAEQLAKRLLAYAADDAAKILVTLEPERARELLDALPEAQWQAYAEAYSEATARASAR